MLFFSILIHRLDTQVKNIKTALLIVVYIICYLRSIVTNAKVGATSAMWIKPYAQGNSKSRMVLSGL